MAESHNWDYRNPMSYFALEILGDSIILITLTIGLTGFVFHRYFSGEIRDRDKKLQRIKVELTQAESLEAFRDKVKQELDGYSNDNKSRSRNDGVNDLS